MSRLAPLLPLAILSLPACALDARDLDALELHEPSPKTSQHVAAVEGEGCEKQVCGPNSPVLGGFPFYELALDKTPSLHHGGLRIKHFYAANGVELTPDVQGTTLSGRDKAGALYIGPSLVGAWFEIEATATGPDPARWKVKIEHWSNNLDYYENGKILGSPARIHSYELSVQQLAGGGASTGRVRPLCPVPNTDTVMFAIPPRDSLFFRGDRYDIETGDVFATGAAVGPWFNVACAGDALSKQVVIRYAEAAETPAFPSDEDSRTASMRMWRADYCGDGEPHTVLGTMIDYTNRAGWLTMGGAPLTPANVEAIWTKDGAACVSRYRIPPAQWPGGPSLSCAPVACTQVMIDSWQTHGELITRVN